MTDLDLDTALVRFFTSTVALPDCQADWPIGKIWLEERDGWIYPWRIVGHEGGVARGYPCGEPTK